VISGNNTTVENIEFTGAIVPNHNGAAIRQKGANLTVQKCYMHGNEEGIWPATTDPAASWSNTRNLRTTVTATGYRTTSRSITLASSPCGSASRTTRFQDTP